MGACQSRPDTRSQSRMANPPMMSLPFFPHVRGRSVICLLILALLACAQRQVDKSHAAAMFGRWFVTPTPALTDSLAAMAFTCAQWDSVARAAGTLVKHDTGEVVVGLRDPSGRPHVLGYLTPHHLRADTLYPLVIYLHGGTGTQVSIKGQKAWDMLRPLSDTFELFLASPSADRTAPWWSPQGLERILQAMRFLTLRYPIDPDRIFLAGVSDGAAGCYAAANTVPSPFAGFIAVSGYGGMLVQLGMPLVPGNLGQRPIYNVNGGKDHIYPIAEVDRFVRYLQGMGVGITSMTYPQEQHGFDYRAREFGTLARLVRAWARPARPGFGWSVVEGFPMRADNVLSVEVAPGAREPPLLSGYFQGDTMVASLAGIQSCVVCSPAPGARAMWQRVNNRAARTLRPLRISSRTVLEVMQQRCFPQTACPSLYELRAD